MKRTTCSNRIRWVVLCLLLSLTCVSCARAKVWYYYEQATKEHDRGNLKDAIHLYKKALNINPSVARIQYDLGVAYLDNHDYAGASVQIDKLTKMGRTGMAGQLTDLQVTAENMQSGNP